MESDERAAEVQSAREEFDRPYGVGEPPAAGRPYRRGDAS